MQQLDLFYNYCRLQGLSDKTLKGLQYALSLYLRRFPDPYKVTTGDATAFFSHGKTNGFASARPASPSTYNNVRNALSKFYRWAIANGYTRSNPIDLIPRCKMPRTVPRRLTEEEKRGVLYHAQNFPHRSRFLRARNFAMVATLLMTGLRAQELLHLRNEDVRLKERAIRVRHGKGDKERHVYFSDELSPILRDYLAERHRLRKQSLFFFASYGSDLGLSYKNLREMLLKIGKAARIRFTAHQLRHTCFSMLLEQNVDLGSIQAQAGHASLVSTQIYTQVADKVRQAKINQVSFL